MRIRERFNPRAPCGARPHTGETNDNNAHFNPRAPCGARHSKPVPLQSSCNFNPRAPCGARPLFDAVKGGDEVFQPTRPLRGATFDRNGYLLGIEISTHAPLAGRDSVIDRCKCSWRDFNPRAPCGARQEPNQRDTKQYKISTHAPLAGRDDRRINGFKIINNFNPRAPCGARPLQIYKCQKQPNFNPRAPCGARLPSVTGVHKNFYISTHAPLAGRDVKYWTTSEKTTISTHAPLAGRDVGQGGIPSPSPYFNPRAPCGARRFSDA